MAAGDVTVDVTVPSSQSCYYFDGVDDYITIGNEGSFDFPNDHPLAISLWINPRVVDNNDGMICNDVSGGDPRFSIYLLASGYVRCTIGNGASNENFTSSAFAVAANTWSHIVVSLEPSTFKMWVNNVSQVDTARAIEMVANATTWKIGMCFNHSDYCFPGLIRDVRIYRRALTSEEVTKLYNNKEVNSFQLGGHWKLNGDATDSSPFNHTGSVSGAVPITISKEIYDVVHASRVGATDKYLAITLNSGVINCNINET